MSFETCFDLKQPKLEPKLSETKRLFRLFRFYTETESFDVSTEPKQTEDQPKQFDREQFMVFPFFSFFSILFGFFGLFRNSLFRLFRFYTEIESFDVSIEPKQTEDPPKQFKREYTVFGYFSENLGLFWFVTKQFCLFQLFRYRFEIRNTETNRIFLFLVSRNKPKQTQNRYCFGLFLVRTEIFFCLFRGPNL